MRLHPFESPAFIVGVGRSGTTLLASMLNRHPMVAVTSETHFFRLLEQAGGWKAIQRNWPEGAIAFLSGLHHFYLLNVDPKQVVERINQPSVGSLFKALGDTYAEQSNKPLWIEKTPLHIRYLDAIRAIFPSSPILHIVRDGRDVALSLCKVDWANDSYVQNLHRWGRELDNAETFFKDDNVTLTISYENLLKNPNQTLKKICDFLAISFEPCMLTPDGSEQKLLERDAEEKQNVTKPVLTNNSGKWAGELSPSLYKGSLWLFRESLEKRGYALGESTGASNGWMRIPRDWLVHDNPDHMPPLQLGDQFVSRAAEHNLAVCMETGELFTTPILKDEAIRILSWRFPADAIATGGASMTLSSIMDVIKGIARFKWMRVRYVWLTHEKTGYHEWPLRLRIEKLVARNAFAVICTCNDHANCTLGTNLGAHEKLLHTSMPDFEEKLIQRIQRILGKAASQ